MLLDVSRALMNPGQSYAFSGSVAIAPMEVLDDPVSFEDVQVNGEFVGSGESVTVRAAVKARLNTRCSRCLGAVTMALETALQELYTRESDPENPDSCVLDGHTVDLTDQVREALLLEMPMRILCSEDCKGLCPRCGVNRNKELCLCQEGGDRTNPFSALSRMLSEDEEV